MNQTLTMARAYGGRVEHFVDPIRDTQLQTMCGKDAKPMARFTNAERGMDSKSRPVCAKCQAAYATRHATIDKIGA